MSGRRVVEILMQTRAIGHWRHPESSDDPFDLVAVHAQQTSRHAADVAVIAMWLHALRLLVKRTTAYCARAVLNLQQLGDRCQFEREWHRSLFVVAVAVPALQSVVSRASLWIGKTAPLRIALKLRESLAVIGFVPAHVGFSAFPYFRTHVSFSHVRRPPGLSEGRNDRLAGDVIINERGAAVQP